MKYMFSKGYEDTIERPGDARLERVFIMPQASKERWQRQMYAAYADLPEEEKGSDRVEADRILEILIKHADAFMPAPAALELTPLEFRALAQVFYLYEVNGLFPGLEEITPERALIKKLGSALGFRMENRLMVEFPQRITGEWSTASIPKREKSIYERRSAGRKGCGQCL